MAKQRLFPEHEPDRRDPQTKFADTAAKVFSVPKAEIDKREKEWRKNKSRKK